MAYNYFCTYCGKELNQDTIYFNMFPVLTGNTKDDQFAMLRFHMTKQELETLVSSGTRLENGYSRCRLSFAELMGFMGNSRNNNNPEMTDITLQDVDDYIAEEIIDSEAEFSTQETSTASLFGEDTPSVPEPEVAMAAEEKPAEKTYAKGILALESAITKNENIINTREKLREEFRTLRGIYSQGDACEFELTLDFEDDNDGKPVLIGYTANAGTPRRLVVADNRLCPHCGTSVIEHAGTAEHKTITFIGDQKAGKTSTIVSLAHYALHAAADNMPATEIWHDCAPVGGIDFMELVSKDDAQQKDLKLYTQGIAPKKTSKDNREDAYAVSFRIKNTCQNKHYLLTLTDLPGELFDNETGKLKTEDVLETFPIALACDLFVLCFDTLTAKGSNAIDMVQKAGTWTNEIQKLRQAYHQTHNRDKGLTQKIKGSDGVKALSAPIMILYTKCPDLEEPEANPLPMSRAEAHDRIARTYMYDKERRKIDGHQSYRYLGERLAKYDMVANAYQARLRCSPFGFAAPNEKDVVENPDKYEYTIVKNEKTGVEEKVYNLPAPQPKHIDMLMRWLLMVSGCVPIPAEYRPYADPTSIQVYQYMNKYILSHTQYRMLNPGATASVSDKDADLHEALARCYLFENPGKFDSSMLSNYDNWAMLLIDRMNAKRKRN